MTTHEGFQDLAAAAIDFELSGLERAELEHHLLDCPSCRRTAVGYREDGMDIAAGVRPRLPDGRSAAILERVLRPPSSLPTIRLLAVAATLALLGAGIAGLGIGQERPLDGPPTTQPPGPSAAIIATPSPAASSTAPPSASADAVETLAPTPSGTASAPVPVPSGGLFVATPAAADIALVRTAPAPDGDLFTIVPDGSGLSLSRLDAQGRARDGWPIPLAGATACQSLFPVDDGSVRVVCLMAEDGDTFVPTTAFAVDAGGRTLPGWPIVLDDHGVDLHEAARLNGDRLVILTWTQYRRQTDPGEPFGDYRIMTIDADGAVQLGLPVADGGDCCARPSWAIGPDGVAYGVADTLQAVGPGGRPDWRRGAFIELGGFGSRPTFDEGGRIRIVVVPTDGARSATVTAFDKEGEAAVDGPLALGIDAANACLAFEGSCEFPAPPLVAGDGTTIVVGWDAEGPVAVLAPYDYLTLANGWQYRPAVAPQEAGTCPRECDAFRLGTPVLGRDGRLFMIGVAVDETVGGSIIAVDAGGQAVDGWPVTLTRPGAVFLSLAVADDGTVFALAMEPEPGGGTSATIIAIAPDSTTRWTATILER